MTPEMIALLKDLADVLEKHKGGLTYTTDDKGIYVVLNGDWYGKCLIEFPEDGNVYKIRAIIRENRN